MRVRGEERPLSRGEFVPPCIKDSDNFLGTPNAGCSSKERCWILALGSTKPRTRTRTVFPPGNEVSKPLPYGACNTGRSVK